MKRSGFARPSLEKIRAYEARQATARRARGMSEQPRPVASRKARRRNDAPWRALCVEAYGGICAVPGCGSTRIQMDHIIARSQGGPSVVGNGLPLCDEYANGHHAAKTAGTLKIRREWLTERQIDWLRRNGHAEWLPDGTVAGRHCPQFAPAERIAA